MQEVNFDHDVKLEPGVSSVSKNVKLAPGSKTENNAGSDVSTRGIFSSHE